MRIVSDRWVLSPRWSVYNNSSQVREHHRRRGQKECRSWRTAGELCNTLFGHVMVLASMNLLRYSYQQRWANIPAPTDFHGLKTKVLTVGLGCLGDTCGGSEGRVEVNVIKIHWTDVWNSQMINKRFFFFLNLQVDFILTYLGTRTQRIEFWMDTVQAKGNSGER